MDNVLLEAFSPEDTIKQLHTIIDENILSYRSLITPYIHDEHSVVIPALCKGSKIVVEGSQSFYLDIDQGDYPYVTSSSPSTSGTSQQLASVPFTLITYWALRKPIVHVLEKGLLIPKSLVLLPELFVNSVMSIVHTERLGDVAGLIWFA